MTPINTDNQIRFSTVGISDVSVSEYDQEISKITISTNKIIKITLEFGSPVERPLSNLFVCIVLLGIGVFLGLWPLYTIFSSGDIPSSTHSLKLFVMAAPLVALGGWFLFRFFQKKYYLKIETENDTRKIVFENATNEQEIKTFIKQVKKQCGVKVEF